MRKSGRKKTQKGGSRSKNKGKRKIGYVEDGRKGVSLRTNRR
jgi:hypothetical protein